MSKIAENAVKYAEVSGQALKAATALADKYERELRAAEQHIPQIVDQLKQAGLIPAGEVKAAAEELGSHSTALQILGNVIEELQGKRADQRAKEASLLGGPASDDTEQPRHDKYANFPGRIRGEADGPAESDKVFFQRLGLNPPTAG